MPASIASSPRETSITKFQNLPALIDAEIDKANAAVARGEKYEGEVVLAPNMPINAELAAEIDRLQRNVEAG